MDLTSIERKALEGIAQSDYMNGPAEANRWVWSWSGNTFDSAQQYSGAVSALVKKGLVKTDGNTGRDACVALTEAGLAALWQAYE